jgi:hypothetical protein
MRRGLTAVIFGVWSDAVCMRKTPRLRSIRGEDRCARIAARHVVFRALGQKGIKPQY